MILSSGLLSHSALSSDVSSFEMSVCLVSLSSVRNGASCIHLSHSPACSHLMDDDPQTSMLILKYHLMMMMMGITTLSVGLCQTRGASELNTGGREGERGEGREGGADLYFAEQTRTGRKRRKRVCVCVCV